MRGSGTHIDHFDSIARSARILAYPPCLFAPSIFQARLYEIENEGQQLTVKRASKLLANNIARYEESVGVARGREGSWGGGKKCFLSLVVDNHSLPFDASRLVFTRDCRLLTFSRAQQEGNGFI